MTTIGNKGFPFGESAQLSANRAERWVKQAFRKGYRLGVLAGLACPVWAVGITWAWWSMRHPGGGFWRHVWEFWHYLAQ